MGKRERQRESERANNGWSGWEMGEVVSEERAGELWRERNEQKRKTH